MANFWRNSWYGGVAMLMIGISLFVYFGYVYIGSQYRLRYGERAEGIVTGSQQNLCNSSRRYGGSGVYYCFQPIVSFMTPDGVSHSFYSGYSGPELFARAGRREIVVYFSNNLFGPELQRVLIMGTEGKGVWILLGISGFFCLIGGATMWDAHHRLRVSTRGKSIIPHSDIT